MNQVDRLRIMFKEELRRKEEKEIKHVFQRMNTEQLREIVYGNPTESRLHEILASVDGLNLLESG